MFQSRNRDTSDFNTGGTYVPPPCSQSDTCFNLVIEILLISTIDAFTATVDDVPFQSRNRDTSDFNCLERIVVSIRPCVSIS